MAKKINDHVTWVGKVDWELRRFHGEEYSTHRGSSYNSYLVRGEKNILIDTVWAPYTDEFIANLEKEIPLERIDAIIASHAESDHSGALPELLRKIPGTPVYCTANAVKSLKGHYHEDWNFHVVKTGDRISLGAQDLVFVEAPMLHWPDSMFSYLTGDHILFSNDAFGQHYATEDLFNDKVDQGELFQECLKYYANILTPFSAMVTKKIQEFVGMNLPLEMICTSHGVIWRDNPLQIVGKYQEWAADYQENQVTILYDTMWSGTRRMAEAVAEGVHDADPKTAVKLFNIARSDKNDLIAEVFKSKAVLVGCPTVNRGVLSSTAGILEEIRGLGFRGKRAAAFGAYGWSGESPAMISTLLTKAGFDVKGNPLKAMWNPDAEAIVECKAFGQKFMTSDS